MLDNQSALEISPYSKRTGKPVLSK